MEIHSAGQISFAKLHGLICALATVLLASLTLIPACAADCDYQIDLAAEQQDQPGLSDQIFGGQPEERYYLMLDGEFLVSAEEEKDLTELVLNVAGRYVNNSTVSCYLEDEEQLRLYHGAVSMWAANDLEAAEETLLQELNVITVEETVTEKTIPYDRVQVEDPDRYVDEDPVVTPGVDGLKEVTTRAVCENGTVMQLKVADTRILVETVDEVTAVGVKERPLYIWPVEGRISSHFGPRNISGGSKNHKGVDIAVPKGTEVMAARAGTVIWSGWNGGYGYLVKIEHEDGSVTYYGHNSELIAQVGDEVEQGDVIALSGSTGQSTGPHCHFEIRIDGTPVDPEDYLEAK